MTRGRATLVAGGGLSAVALLVLMAPLATAVGPVTSYHAPYTSGTMVRALGSTIQGPSAAVTLLYPPSFSLATGLANGRVTAQIGPMLGATTVAVQTTTLGVSGLAVTTGAAGNYTLTVGWTVAYHGSMMVKSTVPMGHALESMVRITLQAYLVEPTTGLAVTGSFASVTVWSQMLASGQFAYAQTPLAFAFGPAPVALVGSHTYTIYTTIQFVVGAMALPGVPPGSTVATTLALDPATALTSVRVV